MREDDKTTAMQLHALLKLKGYQIQFYAAEQNWAGPSVVCILSGNSRAKQGEVSRLGTMTTSTM